MAVNFVFKLLEDRLQNLEDKMDSFYVDIHKKIDQNFKFQNLLIFLGSLPTLQALGVPTREIGSEIIKKALSVIGIILHL